MKVTIQGDQVQVQVRRSEQGGEAISSWQPPKTRPILALTMGDPVGIGPEIIVKALADAQIYQVCRPLVLGDFPALERARLELSPAVTIHLAERPELGRYKAGTMDLMALSELKPQDLEYGHPTQASGKAMVSYILKAIDLALERQVGRHGHRAHQQDFHEPFGLPLSRPYRVAGG